MDCVCTLLGKATEIELYLGLEVAQFGHKHCCFSLGANEVSCAAEFLWLSCKKCILLGEICDLLLLIVVVWASGMVAWVDELLAHCCKAVGLFQCMINYIKRGEGGSVWLLLPVYMYLCHVYLCVGCISISFVH